MDVAPLTHRIFSAEPGLILIHQLLKPKISDKKYYQQSLTLCKFKWILKFKIEISASFPLKSISCSFIGDFFISLYPSSFCIWTKAIGKRFESVFCCHSESECPIPSKNSLRVFSTEVNHSTEISTDGRLITVQALSSSVVKVWYNKIYQTDNELPEVADLTLASFSLEHEVEVLICRVKKQDFFETIAKHIPNLILTITKDYKIHLWLENFGQNNIEFFCFETITEFTSIPIFSFARYNSKEQVYNCPKESVIKSKLLNPHIDKIFQLLKKHNEMGIRKSNYPSDSNDWLCFITVYINITYRIHTYMYIKL